MERKVRKVVVEKENDNHSAVLGGGAFEKFCNSVNSTRIFHCLHIRKCVMFCFSVLFSAMSML